MAHANCAIACVRRSARLMCVSSCTSAACRASTVHDAADGGIITTDENKPATCGLPSFSDCLTATESLQADAVADDPSFVVPTLRGRPDPLQTDTPLSSQQNRNQPRTPMFQLFQWFQGLGSKGSRSSAFHGWFRAVGTTGTLEPVGTHPLEPLEPLEPIGTLIRERHDGRREQDDEDGEMPHEVPRRRSGAAKQRRRRTTP